MATHRRLACLVVALAALALVRPAALLLARREHGAREPLVIVSPHWEGIRAETGEAFERAMARAGRPEHAILSARRWLALAAAALRGRRRAGAVYV